MKQAKPELLIYSPVVLEPGGENERRLVRDILARREAYGLNAFLLVCPSKGWRAVGHPPAEHYEELARAFRAVQSAVAPHGVTCAWWLAVTVKAGRSPAFPPMIRADGSEPPFSSCPLDAGFRRNFAGNAARFARIARPPLIFLEDDYSIRASTGSDGCFCERHLDEFAKRVGRRYTREELAALFRSGTPEAIGLNRKWRELTRDTMVGLSAELRRAIDAVDPEIAIGLMEPGCAAAEGDMAEAVSRALAGPRHRPVCRVCGAGYNGFVSEELPSMLYHALWMKERTPEPFCLIHESDTYPHTRFYSSALQMRAMMGAVCSFGYEGFVFQTQDVLDDPNEECGYAEMIAEERTRFAAAAETARACAVSGVQVPSDAYVDSGRGSDWVPLLTAWGIPFTTRPSSVAVWTGRTAETLPDEEIREQLRKGLLVDGPAARALAARGYGTYLGAAVGEDLAVGMRAYDLAAREHICEGFAPDSVGRDMPGANCYSCKGSGPMLELTVTDPRCEVVTETYGFEGDRITPSVTRFENRLGGRVAVLGTAVGGNRSQSLCNYRRKKLMQELIAWLGGDFAAVRGAPKVWPVMNAPRAPGAGFLGMLTLENFSEDELPCVTLRLPAAWRGAREAAVLDRKGRWRPVPFERTEDGVTILRRLPYLAPTYVRFR